jgi:hypothetical protein
LLDDLKKGAKAGLEETEGIVLEEVQRVSADDPAVANWKVFLSFKQVRPTLKLILFLTRSILPGP